MSGKPYNIKEFKIMVDYLVEHKLYGEIKARKMWVDFANTKLTSRTWQSLKETFLKRVLPDIHNPYFNLTNEQISSFQSRCDLAERNKNKLDMHTVSEDDSNGQNPKDNEPSNNEGETTAGENIKCSKVRSRSSADTVILENCHETSEEIQKILEGEESDEKAVPSKSFGNCINYDDASTPVREMLNDFASEPEDTDRGDQLMEIIENIPEEKSVSEFIQVVPNPKNTIPNNESVSVAENTEELPAEVVEEVLAQELDSDNKPENESSKKKAANLSDEVEQLIIINLDDEIETDEISTMQAENETEKDDAETETSGPTKLFTAENTEKPVDQNSGTPDVIIVQEKHEHSEPQEQSGSLNHSNGTVDASLPNNPEALKNKISTKDGPNKETPESVVVVSNTETHSGNTPSPKKVTRKRSSSEDNSNTIDSKKKKLDIKLQSPTDFDTKADNNLKANKKVIKPVLKQPLLENNPNDINKPSTSSETQVVDINGTEKSSDISKESPEVKNPCLQNISLFDEQFNKTNYNMSESSDTEQNKKESQLDKQEVSLSKPSQFNEVVVLRSNSNSGNEEVHALPKKKQRAGVVISKTERDKAIANMFGFTSGGGVGAKRKRQLSRRRRTKSNSNAPHHTVAPASNSSNWTSESASEDFVSPPRSRKCRPSKKYIKPRAARISALEEEGGLFVMYGKKIYPLIKDGKIVKNYITYLPESDSEDESFWKQKYAEEKIKTTELEKLLQEAKGPRQLKYTVHPVPEAKPLTYTRPNLEAEPLNGAGNENYLARHENKEVTNKTSDPVKLKYTTQQNEEVQLEGNWKHINSVFQQVLQLFKEPVPSVNENKATVVINEEPSKKLRSETTIPVDLEVHEKVNEIEKEIFQEIEDRDKERDTESNGKVTNVTKRRKPGRPQKLPPSAHTPVKQPEISNEPETKEPDEISRKRRQKAIETENYNNTEENVSKRQTPTEENVAKKQTRIDGRFAKRQTPTEENVAKRQTRTEEIVAKRQTPTEENVAKRQTRTEEIVAKRQTPTEENVAKRQTRTEEIVAKRQTPTEENVAKRQTRIDGRFAKRQTPTEENVAKRQTRTEENVAKRQTPTEENVAKRQTRTEENVAKRQTPTEENVAKRQTRTEENVAKRQTPTEENVAKRQTRTPRKFFDGTVNINESKTMQTRRSTQKVDLSVVTKEDRRYMSSPEDMVEKVKSPANKKTNQTKKSLEKVPEILSSPDNVSLNSIDSTQGYQDSDVSLVNTEVRRKKKIDMSRFMIKTRNSLRRSMRKKTHPYLYHDAYNDSSNSSVDAPVEVVTRENSSLNTEAYRSESYQLLNPQAKESSRRLEPIDETTPINNENYFVRHLESICRNEISEQINNNLSSPSSQMASDVGSSSNVSLPLSPELSVVENMSVSREMLNTANFPTINEMQSNEINEATMCCNYMITDVDVSVPLMNQKCELEHCNTAIEMSIEPKSLVTESLLKKIGTFNLNDQVSTTETLNKKLHDLLLESAKKAAGTQCLQEASMMDVDVCSIEVQKKPKANKKRCSTPQKRKGLKKLVGPTVDPVVEEEHVESCSHSGRKSCPPLFQTNLCDDNVVTEEINIANLTIANKKPKGRKKKDIIRVKIQRPKNKKATEKLCTQSAQNASRISVFTDSGINDSSEVFVPANDSVDLIHNHSETCLHANECVGDSIEFVENSKSVITLGDSMQSGDNAWNSRCENNEEPSTSPDLFCNNAQDVSFYNRANTDHINNVSDTVYYSPSGTEPSFNSLITEDLSDDAPPPARPTKWYLLSEDETNTNLVGAGSSMLSSGSYGSNLRQLFPIACAIPNLSAITEMSRENDSSRKPTLEDLDGLTADDFNTINAFDYNF